MQSGARKIQSVLFMCNFNSVRSLMASALTRHYFGQSLYVQSAGIRKGRPDGFTSAVLDEIGIDVQRYQPKTISELEEWEGLNFDLIISMTPEAHHTAMELTRTIASDVEYWPTPDPAAHDGNREQTMEAYRGMRDALMRKIRARFKY